VTGSEGRRLPRPATLPTDALEVWTRIVEHVPGIARDPEPLDPYTPAVRQVYAMSRLNVEVNNGGFSQFLYNGGGVWFDDAISGFEAAGLIEHRLVTVEAADAALAGIESLTAALRRPSIEAYATWAEGSGLGAFDDRWYALPDIDEGLDGFVAERADEIWEPAR
jgi:hypothetical protein